ncbi:O-antigen ligase family protein [Persephonella sp.]
MKKYRLINYKLIYLYLLIISAFISISIFEIFIVIGVLWTVYELFKEKKWQGRLKTPLLVFGGVSVFSTILFAPKMIAKSIEEGIFQFIYFLKIDLNKEKISKLIVFLILIGILLLPVEVYKYWKYGKFIPLWGSTFETGQFYGMFSLIAVFLSFYLFSSKKNRSAFIFLGLAIFYFIILVLTHRRSPLMGYMIVGYLSFLVLYLNGYMKKLIFWGANLILTLSILGGYIYLSKTDIRFQTLNDVLSGKKEISFKTLNRISSARVGIGIDAVNIIKNDIKEGNWINLLIGHGVRSGYYLPHQYSQKSWAKYESVFLLSEFIEKGIVGLIAVLAIFYIAFKTFLTVKIRDSFDIVALGLFVPLLIHLIGSFFTFFWDALLPMYLLLFKIGEMYFKKKSEAQIQQF